MGYCAFDAIAGEPRKEDRQNLGSGHMHLFEVFSELGVYTGSIYWMRR